ncbi:MAG TPA: CAP domain-containing protein [Planctomycetota bacterium]|nr:CAP domain-containing protein [Planctomycetota bacterium]
MKHAFILLSFLFASSVLAAEITAAPEITADGNDELEREILRRVNEQRQGNGLEGLQRNDLLTEAARDHSENMARQNLLSHELDGKGPEFRIKNTGYKALAIAENVAFNDPTAEAVVKSWMNSPGHRANILNKNYTEAGVGIARNEKGQPYYTLKFGRPGSAGATSNATFRVRNESDTPVQIGMTGQEARSQLSPGASGQFSMSGMGELPKMTVSNDKNQQKEFEAQDGKTYVIDDNEQGLMVRTDEQFK